MKWLTNLFEAMAIARQRQADYMVQSLNGTQPIPEHIELKKAKKAKKSKKKTRKNKKSKA